jgi:hypothetical protein
MKITYQYLIIKVNGYCGNFNNFKTVLENKIKIQACFFEFILIGSGMYVSFAEYLEWLFFNCSVKLSAVAAVYCTTVGDGKNIEKCC